MKKADTFRISKSQARLRTGNISTHLSRTDPPLAFSKTAWNMLCRSALWGDGLQAGTFAKSLPSCLNIATKLRPESLWAK